MSLRFFKLCPGCRTWLSFDDILHDPNIHPTGIQVDPHDDRQCFLYFHHDTAGCGTSMVIHSRDLPISYLRAHVQGTTSAEGLCPGYCSSPEEIANCSATCTVGTYRNFMLTLSRGRRSAARAAF
ncbi:MAG: hypothetical protein WAU88_14740 [Candidatus Zixiibacteriota bacterium]